MKESRPEHNHSQILVSRTPKNGTFQFFYRIHRIAVYHRIKNTESTAPTSQPTCTPIVSRTPENGTFLSLVQSYLYPPR